MYGHGAGLALDFSKLSTSNTRIGSLIMAEIKKLWPLLNGHNFFVYRLIAEWLVEQATKAQPAA